MNGVNNSLEREGERRRGRGERKKEGVGERERKRGGGERERKREWGGGGGRDRKREWGRESFITLFTPTFQRNRNHVRFLSGTTLSTQYTVSIHKHHWSGSHDTPKCTQQSSHLYTHQCTSGWLGYQSECG